jgi:Leucine-rich repeat (LRR) protein
MDINVGGTLVMGTDIICGGSLLVQNGAVVQLHDGTAGRTLTLNGNFNFNTTGALSSNSAQAGTLIINGSGNPTTGIRFGAAPNNVISSFTLNRAGSALVPLLSPLVVKSAAPSPISLNDGVLQTTPTNLLTLRTSLATGTTGPRFINGPFALQTTALIGSGSMSFPVSNSAVNSAGLVFFTGPGGVPNGTTITATPETGPMTGDGVTVAATIPAPQNRWRLDVTGGVPDANFLEITDLSISYPPTNRIARSLNQMSGYAVPAGATPNMPVGSKISMNFSSSPLSLGTQYFTVGAQFTAPSYTWNGMVSTDWQNPNNWSPTRTAPAVTDQITLSGTHTITNIPSQTLGQLTIPVGADITLQCPTPVVLTVNGGMDIALMATLNLGNNPLGTNSRITIIAQSTDVVGGATLFVGDNAAVRVSSSFNLAANATLLTSRADGINGTSELTGAIQVTGGASANYTPGCNIGFTGTQNQNAQLQSVGALFTLAQEGRNPKETSELHAGIKNSADNIGTLIINKPGGTAAVPRVVTIGDGVSLNIANGIDIQPPAGSFTTLEVASGVNLTLNGGTTTLLTGNKIRNQGTVILNMPATVNVQMGAEIEMNNAANWVTNPGAMLNYQSNSILRYTGTISSSFSGEMPTPMPMLADVYLQKTSGASMGISFQRTFNGRLFVSCLTEIFNSITLNALGNQIQSGGRVFCQSGMSSSMVLTPMSSLEVLSGGAIAVHFGVITQNGGTLTIRSGGLLERGDITYSGLGMPGIVYEPNSTLRLIDYGGLSYNLTPGSMELPLVMQGNLEIQNLATTTINAPSLTLNGSLTVGTGNTTSLTNTLTVNGGFNLFGTIQLPAGNACNLNGALNLTGTFQIPNNPMSSLAIAGSGAVTGSLKVLANTFNAGTLALNRAGMTLPLGSPVIMGQNATLSLQRGIIRTDASNILILTNPAISAISQENPNSYIDGPLQRYFLTNAVNATQGIRFPIGKNGKYMPVSLFNYTTGGNAPLLQAEVFDTAPPNMMRDSSVIALSQSEYWRVDLLSGTYLGGQAAFERSQPIALNAVIAKAPSTGGIFTSIGSSVIVPPNPTMGLFNYAIGSSTFNTFSLFSIASPTPPPPVVIPPALQATITSFFPTRGTSGTTVIVTGANFTLVRSASIGGVPVPFMVQSPNRIELGPIGLAQTGPITIQTSTNGTATSATFTFIPAPTITSVQPIRSGIGQNITINGTDLVVTPRSAVGLPDILPQVNIGGIGANTVQTIAPTQLVVSFPAITSGTLRVQAWGGFATTATVEILPPPVIVGVSPIELAPGFLLTVTGANFLHTSQVRVGGVPALAFTVNAPDRITVVVPPNARGGVSITTPGGTVTNATVVNVISPPTVSNIAPSTALVGTPITITGTNYIGVSNVLIGGIRATFTIDSSRTRITAIVPPNGASFASTASVSVTAVGGTITATQRITVLPQQGPVLTGFSPNPATVGGTLVLTGINLPTNIPPNPPTSLVSVSINGVVVPVQSVSGGTISLVLPAAILSNALNSTNAVISFTSPNGSTTASFLVPVLAPNAPAFTSFAPSVGGAATSLVLMGQNLGVAPRGTVLGVSVAGVPVRSFMVVSTTQIVAVLGNISTSITSGNVAITTPSGILTLSQQFRFDPNFVPPMPVTVNDSLALVALYNAAGGAGWANRANWLQDFVSTWHGVRVENGRVVELRLPQNSLSGQIGTLAEFANLDALRVLDLSGNRLVGVLPASFAGLRSLETLNLSDNTIVGEIGQVLCGLKQIKDLNIANNRIQGELSTILCCFPRLERARLQNNSISGRLPFCLRDLQSLTVLDASNNRLSDTLPAWMGDMAILTELRLRGNLLRGKLPPEWGQRSLYGKRTAQTQALEGLSVLDIAQNQLSGDAPSEWGGLTSLRELSMEQNDLTGAVPLEWQNLRNLRRLSLAGNRLTAIPDLTQIRRLDTLAVEGNALDFAALEPNSPIRIFTYAPQREQGSPSTTVATIDALFSQRFLTGGSNNRYEWRKIATSTTPERIFPATNDGIMRIAAFAPSDTGVYRCVVTNTLLPALTLTSATVRVLSTNPTTSPNALTLISPQRGEQEISLRPVLVWVPSAGASHYDIELSTNANFIPVNVRDRVAQSVEGLLAQRMETLAPLVQAETRYFWRVRAVNSVGAGAWSDVRDLRDFRTVRADVAVSVESVNFGDVPRQDTAQAIMRVVNVTNQPIIINQVRLSPPNFLADAIPVAQQTIAPGQALMLGVRFLPQTLGLLSSPVTLAYTLAGTRTERSFDGRLTGTGVALKIIPPNFDDVIVNRPRISSGFIINRGNTDAIVRKVDVLSARTIYEYLPSADSLFIGVGDTAAAVFRCRPRTSGVIERGLVRYEANVDTAEIPLTANARFLRPDEVLARLGIRAVPPVAPPGARVILELFLQDTPNEPITATQRQSLFRQLVPTAQVLMNFSKNVLALRTDTVQIARRITNRAVRNRTERVIVPLSAWDERNNGNVLARFPVLAVAGEIDVTKLLVEDVNWSGTAVESDTLQNATFRAEACEAGGKRLVTTAQRNGITAIAPNPAKDVLNIAYSVREDGFVEIYLVDMRGSVILSALHKEHAAGEYVMSVPLQNVPQGAYLLRLSAPNAVITRRVEVVR